MLIDTGKSAPCSAPCPAQRLSSLLPTASLSITTQRLIVSESYTIIITTETNQRLCVPVFPPHRSRSLSTKQPQLLLLIHTSQHALRLHDLKLIVENKAYGSAVRSDDAIDGGVVGAAGDFVVVVFFGDDDEVSGIEFAWLGLRDVVFGDSETAGLRVGSGDLRDDSGGDGGVVVLEYGFGIEHGGGVEGLVVCGWMFLGLGITVKSAFTETPWGTRGFERGNDKMSLTGDFFVTPEAYHVVQ